MSCSPFSCLSLSKFRCLFFFPHLPRMCGKLNVPTKHVLDTSISIWFCFPSKPIRSIEQVSSRFNVPYKENMQAPQAAIIIPFYLHMAVKKQMKNICRRRIICIQLRMLWGVNAWVVHFVEPARMMRATRASVETNNKRRKKHSYRATVRCHNQAPLLISCHSTILLYPAVPVSRAIFASWSPFFFSIWSRTPTPSSPLCGAARR